MKHFKRVISTVLAAAFALSMGATAFAESNVKQPGQEGFVKLTQYIQATEVPDVYKLYLSVGATNEPKPMDIAIVLDNSGSMNQKAAGPAAAPGAVGTGPVSGTRWDWAIKGATKAIDIFWNSGVNTSAELTRVGVESFVDVGGGTRIGPSFTTLVGQNTTPNFNIINGGNYYDITPAADGFLNRNQWEGLKTTLAKTGNAPSTAGTDMNYALSWLDSSFFGNAVVNHEIPGKISESFGSAKTGSSTSYKENVKRYVIFLSDGADTSNIGGVTTLDVATHLKDRVNGYNAEFYTIGLNLPQESGKVSSYYDNWNSRASQAEVTAMLQPDIPWNPVDPKGAFYDGSKYYDIPGDQYLMGDVGATLISMSMKINKPYTLGTITNEATLSLTSTILNPFEWVLNPMVNFPITPGNLVSVVPNSAADSVAQRIADDTSYTGPGSGSMFEGWTKPGYDSGVSPGGTTTADAFIYYNRDTWNRQQPNFYMANNESELGKAFETIAKKIVYFGRDVKVNASLNLDQFELYTGMASAPQGYEVLAGLEDQSIKANGGKLVWDMEAIPNNGVNSIALYVKLNRSAVKSGLNYSVLKNLNISYIDDKYFFDADGNLVETAVQKDFPISFVEPSGKIINPATQSDAETPALSGQTIALSPTVVEGKVSPLGDLVLTRHQSSNQKVVVEAQSATIYQKTTSGAYKAIASAKKGASFTVLSEEGEYQKIVFMKKGAEKGSMGYIKTSDVKKLEVNKSENVSNINTKALAEAQLQQQEQANLTATTKPSASPATK